VYDKSPHLQSPGASQIIRLNFSDCAGTRAGAAAQQQMARPVQHGRGRGHSGADVVVGRGREGRMVLQRQQQRQQQQFRGWLRPADARRCRQQPAQRRRHAAGGARRQSHKVEGSSLARESEESRPISAGNDQMTCHGPSADGTDLI
jgi:hypothetical protein